MKHYKLNQWNGLESLKKLKLGKNVSNIQASTFEYNLSIEDVEIDGENPTYIVENGAIYTKDKTTLVVFFNRNATKFEIAYGVKKIESSAFFQKDRLTELIIPETINFINYAAFSYCNSLTKLEIPSGIEYIEGSAFSNCPNLREIVIRKERGSIAGSPWGCIYGDRAIKWQP